jgi:amidase
MRLVVKDVIDVEGVVTGAGNPDWARTHRPAGADAGAVASLLAAGAELAGKGQCAELAFSLSGDNAHYGMPRNPAAPDRDPGGSTSGPAAAVAGGLAELGLGTDTLGSVRIPASYCGIFGFRPTHGAISTDGVLALAQRFDTVGLLARDGAALRRAAEVLLSGAGDAGRPPVRLLLATDALGAAEPAVAEAVRAAAERLAHELDAGIGDAEILAGVAPGFEGAMEAFSVLQGVEVWRNFGGWVRDAKPALGPEVEARIERARRITDEEVAKAEPAAAAVSARIQAVKPDEAVVLPATGTVAPPRDASAEGRQRARLAAGRLSCLASLAGAPAVSLPLAHADGLPVGLGLVGAPGSDLGLLSAADRAGSGR